MMNGECVWARKLAFVCHELSEAVSGLDGLRMDWSIARMGYREV